MKFSARLTGLPQALAALQSVKRDVENAPKQALKDVGFRIETSAKVNATPYVRFGRHRASFTTNWTDSAQERKRPSRPVKTSTPEDGVGRPTSKSGEFEVVVGSNVSYAVFQEYGARGGSGRFMLTSAYEQHKGEVKKAFTDIIAKKAQTKNTGGAE